MHLNDVTDVLKYIVSNWQTIGAYSIGGVSLAAIAHKVERGYGNLSLQKLGYTIVALGSLAGVLAAFALKAHTAGANWHTIPKNLGYLSSVTLFLHKFVVSDSFEGIAGKLNKFSSGVKALEAEEATLEAQAKPPVTANTQVSSVNVSNTNSSDNQFVG